MHNSWSKRKIKRGRQFTLKVCSTIAPEASEEARSANAHASGNSFMLQREIINQEKFEL